MSTATMDPKTTPPPATAPKSEPPKPETTKPIAIKLVDHKVFATREGLIDKLTASGYRIDTFVSFVALPSWNALRKFVKLTNPKNGFTAYAQVLDVGPWNETDDAYVLGGERPAAESGRDTRGRKTNGAGIDLSETAWKALGMTDNGDIVWQFLA